MNHDKMMMRDLFSLFIRYKIKIFSIVVVVTGFSIQLSYFFKKKYQSSFEINVYSKYFKNALISDIIPGVFQIPEMRFTIDSMVKEVIDDQYLDSIAQKYQIYLISENELQQAKQRQELRNSFKLFSTGGQSYKVTVQFEDPYIAKEIAEFTLERVKKHFIDSRIQTIEMIKLVMLKRLKSFNASQRITDNGVEKALASKSPEVLNAEFKKLNSSISALMKQYKRSHPKIKELLEKKNTIIHWLEEYRTSVIEEIDTASISLPADKIVNGQLTSKFYTKYHDFNMALDIEKKSLDSYIGIIERPQFPVEAIWPKKRLFASLGFLLSLVFSIFYIIINELMLPSFEENLEKLARSLQSDFLGTYSLSSSSNHQKVYKDFSGGENKKLDPDGLV